jgi:hypothetical protein
LKFTSGWPGKLVTRCSPPSGWPGKCQYLILTTEDKAKRTEARKTVTLGTKSILEIKNNLVRDIASKRRR